MAEEKVNELVKKYEGIIFSFAKNYNKCNNDYDDIVQEGYLALIKAIHNYKAEYGASMSTFVYMCVTRAMRTYAMKCANNYAEMVLEDDNDLIDENDNAIETLQARMTINKILKDTDYILTQKEKDTLAKMLESGSSILSVSRELGTTRHATSKCYRRGINKIKGELERYV